MSTKKPTDTDKYGPTYRPKGSLNYGESEGLLQEGDDLPESGDGASRESLGDYLSELTKVNKYGVSGGSKEPASHRDVTGPPPVYDGYKDGGALNGAGSDKTFIDDVIEQGNVKAKDFTLVGTGEYKNPNVTKGEVNPFEQHPDGVVYRKGVQDSRGEGHTLYTGIPAHENTNNNIGGKLGKEYDPGPHVIQQRTSQILENNRFHPVKGSPYVKDGAFSQGSKGTMGTLQKKLGQYDPDAASLEVSTLMEIGRKIMVAGTGHAAGDGEDKVALLPSLNQLGLPFLDVNVGDLRASNVAGIDKNNGEYILSDGGEGAGETENEITSNTSYGHLNSYFETFSGPMPLGMIMVALGGLLAILIQAAVIVLVIELLLLLPTADPERRNPQAPYTMPKGRRQHVKGYNALVGPILNWLGMPELESGKSLFACMMRGAGTFYGLPNLDSVPGLGDLAGMVDALMEQGGFVASIIRYSTRDLEQVVNTAKQIRGSVISIAGGVIGLIKSLGNAASIRFLMLCAKLGDIMYLGDSYDFAPYNANPDLLPESGSTRLAKSRRGPRDARSVLRHGALPSRYLLPANFKTAGLQYGLRMGTGHESMYPIADKIAPWLETNAADNRLSPEYVKTIEDMLECEYVPFYFQDLRTNEIIAFHAFLDSISDDYSPEWSAMSGYGRMDAIQVYNKTSRAISISFMVAATSPADFDEMWYSINKLTTLVYPQWSGGTVMKDSADKRFIMPFSQIPTASPLIRLRIGDLIKNNYSRFNLARIFGVDQDDVEGGNFNIEGSNRFGDAEELDMGSEEFADYFEKLYTVPTDVTDTENGWQDGAFAVLKANSGENACPKAEPPDDKSNDPMYVQVPVNTLVEVVEKTWPGALIIPFISPPLSWPPVYKCKFHYAEDQEIFDGEFYVQHGMLLADIWQVSQDLGVSSLEEEPPPEPPADSNRDFFSPEKNAVVRAFESTAGRGLACAVTSLSYDYADAPWETRKLGSRAPMWVKVSMSFAPIHDIPPGLDAGGFNRAPLYNVGDIMNGLSGPDIHQTDILSKEDETFVKYREDRKILGATIQPRDPKTNGSE